MDDGFDVLEQKVRTAADTVKRLRRENKAHEDETARLRSRLADAEQRLAALEKERDGAGKRSEHADRLAADLEQLRRERQEIKSRIAKLVEVLEELE